MRLADDYRAFVQGGPWSTLRKQRDIVLIGERGTAVATPSIEPRGVDELGKTVFGKSPEARQVTELETRALMKRTHAELTREGVDPSAFNLRELANDIHDTMQALGYKLFDIYGVSFGTLFAQAVAKYHPRHVRALVLDSPVMPDHNIVLEVGRTAQKALDTVFAKADTKYPGLAKTFYGLVDALNAKPHVFTHQHHGRSYKVTITGDDFFAIAMGLMTDNEVLDLPRAMRSRLVDFH